MTESDPIAEATTSPRAAALWWAKQVGAPTFRVVRDEERDFASDFFEVHKYTQAASNPVTGDQGASFADLLEQRITADLQRDREYRERTGDKYPASTGLGVDYGPDPELAGPAEAAGISYSRFPIKSHMWVYDDYVIARLGYGSPNRLVWSSPTWARPACAENRYRQSGDRLDVFDEICTWPKFHDGGHGDWAPDPARCADCGRTYSGHFGHDVPYLGHSWAPTTEPVEVSS